MMLRGHGSLLWLATVAACRGGAAVATGSPLDASIDAAPADAPSKPAPSGQRPAVAPPRCRALARSVVLDQPRGADAVDIGDGVLRADGYAVAMVHQTSAGRVAAVALVSAAIDAARVVDLGPTLGDAPPPRLVGCSHELWAGALARPAAAFGARPAQGLRDLVLYAMTSEGTARRVSSIAQRWDDSLAFDLACSGDTGIAVWDETVPAARGSAARGVIRATLFGGPALGADVRDLSPPESDAEMPRAVPDGAGFSVLWLARRPEAPLPKRVSEREASSDIESSGEAPAYSWIEMIAVDGSGAPIGPVRRITSTTGHVSTYDVQSRVVDSKAIVVVAARDDGEETSGMRGSLLRVRVRNAVAEPPGAWITAGLGRGAPMLIDGPLPWLAWVGPREDLWMLPLDAAFEASAPASPEESLGEGRPLLTLSRGSASGGSDASASNVDGEILVATPHETAVELRAFACGR